MLKRKRVRIRQPWFRFDWISVMPRVSTVGMSWLWFGVVISFVEPEMVEDFILTDSYLVFLVSVFMVVFSTVAAVRRSLVKGGVWGLVIAGFVCLRLWGLGEWYNAVLIGLLLAISEYYLIDKSPKTV